MAAEDADRRARLAETTIALMLTAGLAGHETRVRQKIGAEIDALGVARRTDRLGNLIATLDGEPDAPSVMLIAHMDQLGFIIRHIEPDGFLRLERVGGVPDKAVAAQPVVVQLSGGRDVPGVIAALSHHITPQEDKFRVTPYRASHVDCGFRSAEEARAAGVEVGAPVVYAPRAERLANDRIVGTSVDDRAACAVLIEVLRALRDAPGRPTVHAVFSVQEEFNLRGALPAAQALKPDVCVQLDLSLATDTPDAPVSGDVRLGGGPAMSVFSFHGRGTLNGLIPHPALTRLFADAAAAEAIPLQRAVHMGALTETSYVQLVGEGVACVDLGFPCRGSHSPNEICDLGDLDALARLVVAGVARIGPTFSFDPDGDAA